MKQRGKFVITGLLFTGLLWMYGCGSPASESEPEVETQAEIEDSAVVAGIETKTEFEEEDRTSALVYDHSMELEYAGNFTVDYYEGGYTLLTTTMDGAQFFIVPEDRGVPQNLWQEFQNEEIVVLKRPIKDIYLVASSANVSYTHMTLPTTPYV